MHSVNVTLTKDKLRFKRKTSTIFYSLHRPWAPGFRDPGTYPKKPRTQ